MHRNSIYTVAVGPADGKPGNKLFRRLLLAFGFATLLLIYTGNASASGVMTPNLRYQIVKAVDNSGSVGNTELSSIVLDIRAEYLFDDSGLMLGGIYKLETDQVAAGDTKGSAYGPSIGWMREDLSLILSYFLNASRTYTVIGVPKKFSKGRGWQLDFAWTPHLSENFGLGPAVTWQTLRYAASQIGNGDETSDSYEEARIVPGLAFWYRF
jgi:hypothetical protein